VELAEIDVAKVLFGLARVAIIPSWQKVRGVENRAPTILILQLVTNPLPNTWNFVTFQGLHLRIQQE
jgi:hypothetical protein